MATLEAPGRLTGRAGNPAHVADYWLETAYARAAGVECATPACPLA
jgi:hypothetical protein